MNPTYAEDFGTFDGRIWFNCAHQGPLPQVAVAAAEQAIRQKVTPHLIRDEDFNVVPNALKSSLARLVGAVPEDIILGNSASYGLHVLRNGIAWRSNDEILLVNGEFPATIYPWLGLQESGVRVRFLTPRGLALAPDELAREVTRSTRLLCVSWVNSFNGSVLDLGAVGRVCREHGVIFVVNGSQGVGALQINVGSEPIDALVSCGYKWLCGPYGTGFCWVKGELRNQLKPSQTYWLPHVWGQENLTDYKMREDIGSASFDVFCTANFLNFVPWQASTDYLLEVGIAEVEKHNRKLVEALVNGIEKAKYHLINASECSRQSAIVVVSHVVDQRNSKIHAALAKAGIDIALRNGNLRFSPHLYNTVDEVRRLVSVLNSVS
jgi:selenocysteine lyase/cysteine desulfurase